MKIEKFDSYMDGGTVEVTTDKGVYCFDDRLFSSTKGRLYNGYPEKDNSNLIEDSGEIEKEILEALKDFDDEFYRKSITSFIESRQGVGWKIKYIKGDLLRDAERDYDVIAHGCNCYCTFGAGIAYGVKKKWPEAYEVDKATPFADSSKLGNYSKWSNGNITILNMYTQWDYKGKNRAADYDAIRSCMKWAKQEFTGKKIGLPLIGAGLAGGDWNIIEQIIEEELAGEDVTVVVWERSTTPWELKLVE